MKTTFLERMQEYLKDEYDNKTGNYAADHIYPQNKEWCGLNVKGNLVLVDKVANSAKKGIDVETFMKDDSDFWRDLGVDKATRMKRLNAIKSFQKRNGYDSNTIRSIVSSILNNRYNEIRVDSYTFNVKLTTCAHNSYCDFSSICN